MNAIAEPVSAAGTWGTIRTARLEKVKPEPRPPSAITASACHRWSCHTASASVALMNIRLPAGSRTRWPTRASTRRASWLPRTDMREYGTSTMPAASTLSPRPKPGESARTRTTTRVSREYIPRPATIATRLGAAMPGRTAKRRSTRGNLLRSVYVVQPARPSTPSVPRPIVRALVQPHTSPSETASSVASIATVSPAAPSQSTRGRSAPGAGGTNRHAITRLTPVRTAPSA